MLAIIYFCLNPEQPECGIPVFQWLRMFLLAPTLQMVIFVPTAMFLQCCLEVFVAAKIAGFLSNIPALIYVAVLGVKGAVMFFSEDNKNCWDSHPVAYSFYVVLMASTVLLCHFYIKNLADVKSLSSFCTQENKEKADAQEFEMMMEATRNELEQHTEPYDSNLHKITDKCEECRYKVNNREKIEQVVEMPCGCWHATNCIEDAVPKCITLCCNEPIVKPIGFD